MERANGDPRSTSAASAPAPADRYQPPQIEWEEQFDPVAASPLCSCIDPDCHDPTCG